MIEEQDATMLLKAGVRILATIILIPLGLVAHGWALWALWGWFGEPLSGVVLGFWHAAGVMILLGYLRTPHMPKDDGTPYGEMLGRSLATTALYLPIVVLFGWIVQGLMP